MADLITTTEAAAVEGFAALDATVQSAIVSGASAAVQSSLRRTLTVESYRELHAPEDTRVIRLDQYPVVKVTRVASGLTAVMQLRFTTAGASRANVAFDGTNVVLNSTVNGVAAAPITLAVADYPMVSSMAGAIQSQPGWACDTSNDGWAMADVEADAATRSALGGNAPLWAYTNDLALYEVDADVGIIRVFETRQVGYRSPGRVWAPSGNYDKFKCEYQAGYAVIPDDIKQATLNLVGWMVARLTAQGSGAYTSIQSGTDRADMANLASGGIASIADYLAPYRRKRLA